LGGGGGGWVWGLGGVSGGDEGVRPILARSCEEGFLLLLHLSGGTVTRGVSFLFESAVSGSDLGAAC